MCMKLPSLSVVVPTYNDQMTIKTLIEKIHHTGHTYSRHLEILVLNDASTDKTALILARLSKTLKEVRILTHSKNVGYGKTIKRLYLSADCEWIFSLPGDMQIDPEEIGKLMPYTQTHDIILGKRINRKETTFRLIQSYVYNLLLRMFFSLKVSDANTVRLMKKSVIQSLRLTSKSAFIDAELLIRAQKKSAAIIEVPIHHNKRISGTATGGNLRKTILPTIFDMINYYIHLLLNR